MNLNPLLTVCISLVLSGCSASDNSFQDYKDHRHETIEDSIDDNIEFVNLGYEYANLVNDSYIEVTTFLDSKNLDHTRCNGLAGISVEVIIESHFEINRMRESGAWKDSIVQDSTVSGFFDWSLSDSGSYRMYLARDGKVSLDEIFVHEYTHAYFFANCVPGSNNLSAEEEEEYAELVRKNYIKKDELSNSI